jgi:hypothetical protein
MLDLGSDHGFQVFEFFNSLSHQFALAFDDFAHRGLYRNVHGDFYMLGVFVCLNAGLASVKKDSFFSP